MKIVIVGPGLNMGGMERASVNISNSITNFGCEVIYISLFRRFHFLKLENSVKLIEPDSNLNNKRLNMLKTIFWLKKEIKQISPDSILTFSKFYGAITALAVKGSNIPHFISERSSPHFKWSTKIDFFNRFAYWISPPKGVIAQTNIAAIFQRRYYSKITQIKVIPNALREVQLYPEIKREKQILAVGRLGDHLKGFDLLIEAFSLLKNTDWELVIAGGDENGDYLKKQAKGLNVLHRIRFLGKVKEIDKVYAQAGIFVIPSRSEGFPNALCEAMAAGLPCVSFDFVAGPRDIIKDNIDGLIVENGNISDLAQKMDYLIEKEQERTVLGTNAKKIPERLNEDKIGKEYLDFILVKKNGRK